MTGAAAARIGKRLIEIEYRGHGDLDGAMYRLQSKTGISYWTWKTWWSREPAQGVLPSTWRRLVSWYEIECARQKRLFEEELSEAKALGRDETTDPVIGAAYRLVRQENGKA